MVLPNWLTFKLIDSILSDRDTHYTDSRWWVFSSCAIEKRMNVEESEQLRRIMLLSIVSISMDY